MNTIFILYCRYHINPLIKLHVWKLSIYTSLSSLHSCWLQCWVTKIRAPYRVPCQLPGTLSRLVSLYHSMCLHYITPYHWVIISPVQALCPQDNFHSSKMGHKVVQHTAAPQRTRRVGTLLMNWIARPKLLTQEWTYQLAVLGQISANAALAIRLMAQRLWNTAGWFKSQCFNLLTTQLRLVA